MTPLVEIIFAILLQVAAARVGLGENLGDETEAASELRLWTIATATVDVATRTSWDARRMSLAIVTVTGYESGWWHRSVHVGDLRGDCHGTGARRVCRSVCLGQIHAGSGVVTYHEHKRLTGLDWVSTRRCLAATARALEAARWQCRNDSLEAAFALYGTGKVCSARFARRRAYTFGRLASKHFPGLEAR